MAIVYLEEFETQLQERLSAPTMWKDVCDVKYTNTGVLHNPYLTDATIGTGTRGTGYTSTAVATTDDTIAITSYVYAAQHIDDADLAQKTFTDQMEIADNMAVMLNEKIETQMLAEHAQWTNVGDTGGGAIGAGSTAISVSISNIKNIITGVKRLIRTAGGGDILARKGGFIIWREADYELVEQIASSEGYSVADKVLESGIPQANGGFMWMGMMHYSSSKHTAGHVFAGVNKAFTLGIVKSTYGKVKKLINPVVGGAQISGIGFESRVDNKFKAFTKMVPVLFDVNVV